MPLANPVTSRRQALGFGAAACCIATIPKHPDAAAPSPDAELIRLCDRLVINRALEAAVYEAYPDDDDEREPVLAPIDNEWWELAAALEELDGPRTPEGARAMALAALAEAPRDCDGDIENGDLHERLAIGCARYLAGEGQV
jgi:hypothetical protein